MADVITLTIAGNSAGAVGAVNQTITSLGQLESASSKTNSALGSMFTGAGMAVGLKAIEALSAGMRGAVDTAIGFNSKLEQSTIAFTSMLGSAEKAQAFLAEMKQFAATTPFEFPDLLQAAKQMMAFGFQAKEVKPLLTSVGSAAAAMGTGRSGVDSITKALGQMKAATVVQAGELNQLTEQGVPAFQILADAMGISTGEVKKLASEGKIASDVFITAFQAWADSKYGDMMGKQALTFEGALSNIKDSLTFAVAEGAKPFFEAISAGAVSLSQFVQGETFTAWVTNVAVTSRDAFRQIGDAVRTVQQVLAGEWAPSDQIEAFALAVGTAALTLKTTFGPAVTAIATFITGTLIPAIQEFSEPITAFVAGFSGAIVTIGLFSAAVGVVALALGALLSPIGLVATAVGLLAVAWQTNFLAIRDVVTLVLNGEIKAGFDLFITNLSAMTLAIAAQLLLWGQEFVAWVAPMIPPMLAALADMAVQFYAWITAQIPLIASQLVLWATEFVAWVAPFIPPLIAALTAMGEQFRTWIAAQIPVIAAQLALWGQEFYTWVGPATVSMMGSLGEMAGSFARWLVETQLNIAAGIILWAQEFGKIGVASAPELAKGLTSIFVQIQAFMLTLPAQMLQWGVDAISAFIKGFLSKAIPMPALPSFGGGGGGGGGATALSYTGDGSWQATTSGGFRDNAERLAFVRATATQYGHDPETVAQAAMMEGAGPAGPVGDGGLSFGALQAYTGGGMGNTFQNATGLNPGDPNNEKALVEWQIRQLNQTGWTPYNGPTKAGGYTKFQGINTGSGGMNRIPLSGGPGGDPSQWPGFMNQVEEQLPAYLMSMETIQGKGAEAFAGVLDAAVQSGGALVSASTDSLGNVTRIYSDATGVIGATITDAAGAIVNTWGSMGASVTEQTATMATSVPEQFNLLRDGSLTSVSDLGSGVMTITQDMAGNTVSTITTMGGEIVNQYATLSNGAQINLQDMSTKSTATVDAMAGTITRTVTDMAGNTIVTTTNMAGQVVGQYVTIGKAADDLVGPLGRAADGFEDGGKKASAASGPVTKLKDSLQGWSFPLMDEFLGNLGEIEELAENATRAIVKLDKETGKLRTYSPASSSDNKRHSGGPVAAGVPYLVGKTGAEELFVPDRSGYVHSGDLVPAGGGGSSRNVTNNFYGLLPADMLSEARRQQEKDELMYLMGR